MKINSVKDSLYLILSDEYKISDSNYKKLSDILVNNNLSDVAFDGGIVQIINILYKTGKKFPMSLDLLQQMWGSVYMTFDFKKMLIPMVKNGILKLRKVTTEKFKSDEIDKTDGDINRLGEERDDEKHIVIYNSGLFTKVYKEFESVLSTLKPVAVTESFSSIPNKVSSVANRLNKELNSLGIRVSVESYMLDKGTGIEDVNFTISNIDVTGKTDKDIQKMATRLFSRASYVKNVESYKENRREIYLGISVDSEMSDYRDVETRIMKFVMNNIIGENTEEVI